MNVRRGITWTLMDTLEGIDFADHIFFLLIVTKTSKETNDVASIGRQIRLNINTNETKLMKINLRSDQQITIDMKRIDEEQDLFIWVVSKVTTDGNSEVDVLHRLSKARGAFAELRNIWKSSKIGTETKLRIFKSNVLGVLLYGTEAWNVPQSIRHKIDVV